MRPTNRFRRPLAALALALAGLVAGAALADPPRGHNRYDRYDRHDARQHRGHARGVVIAHDQRRTWRPVVVERRVVVRRGHSYRYRNFLVVRRFGPHYRGYGRHFSDDAAWRWLALTALTIRASSRLNELQLRALETAQISAVTAPVGAPIIWNAAGAAGQVVTIRDGTSTTGLYCREFQQTVIIGGRTEQAFGTACRQPDGAWQVVDTRN